MSGVLTLCTLRKRTVQNIDTLIFYLDIILPYNMIKVNHPDNTADDGDQYFMKFSILFQSRSYYFHGYIQN